MGSIIASANRAPKQSLAPEATFASGSKVPPTSLSFRLLLPVTIMDIRDAMFIDNQRLDVLRNLWYRLVHVVMSPRREIETCFLRLPLRSLHRTRQQL